LYRLQGAIVACHQNHYFSIDSFAFLGTKMMRGSIFSALAGLWLMTSTASAQSQRCDATCLRGMLDQYVVALPKRDARALPLANKVKFTENGKQLALTEGLWSSADKVGGYREFFTDPTTGNGLFVGVIEAGGAPAIIATRLRVQARKITEIETIVARKGSHPLFAPEALVEGDPLFAAVVPEDYRVPRARMIEIANAYFDGIEKNSSEGIPATSDCDRFENGVKTTFRTPTSGNCAKSADNLNYIKAVKDRRYFIVDEATGVVACTIVFDIPGGDPITTPAGGSEAQLQTTLRQPRMLLLTELFKIEAGNISRIQAVMQNLPHGGKSGWEK
jgi:hypothetical protein